jgi:alpha-galactosidase
MTWFLNDKQMPGKDFDYDLARKLLNEYLAVRAYYFGDYYPLTGYNLDPTTWIAWQFDRPDLGEGMVQAFRRGRSFYERARVKLSGLDPNSRYQVKTTDETEATEYSGRELTEEGLPIKIDCQPGAVVVVYKKVRQ